VQRKIINKFRYYSFELDKANECEKILIIYHGWGGTAEGYKELGAELSKEGFKVIVPEIVFHDTQPLENHFDQKTMQDYFWETIIKSIDEFDDFISALEINTENVVIIGSSMGGFIANGIFAREPTLCGLANINGSGSFVLSERLFRNRDNRGDISEEQKNILKKYDPIERVNCGSSVLLIHGDSDEIIPIEGQKDYYRYLKEIEKRSNIDFYVYKNVNHQFTSEMISDLITWLLNCKNRE
jgi:uncharacterized protein